jgi:hypothetical protein
MKKIKTIGILAIIMALLFTGVVSAQEEESELDISMIRNFGYGGFSRDIQGTFTIRVSGPDDLVEVQFYLDDTLMGTDNEARFALQFQTDNYDEGWHDIYAVGILADGTELRSESLRYEFIPEQDMMGTLLPILGVVLAVSLIGVLGPVLMGRKKGVGTIGEYGAAGGAVCGRCGFPFSRGVLSPNLVVGKLERCPHCGKLAIVRRAFPAELEAAEARYHEAQQEQGTVEVDEQDSLRRSLEDSRFDD